MQDITVSSQPDWFHGVDGGGNCLPGPQLPRGIVRVGPDMINHNTSGYASGEGVRHFSHLHVAGTGGPGRYGNIGLMPVGQRPEFRIISFPIVDEEARSGYYACTVKHPDFLRSEHNRGDIRCEMTATRCCAVHRWTFAPETEAWARIDIGTCIAGRSTGGWSRWESKDVLVGCGHYRGGWGHDLPYSVFFRMEFSAPFATTSASSEFSPAKEGALGEGPGLVVTVKFGQMREVQVKVGISFVSVGQAQQHLRDEVGERDFDDVATASAAIWENLLDRFRVSGGTAEDRQIWTTLWQRLHAMPGDLGTDEVPWMDAQKRHFNDLYCLWDSVRCANSLLALVDPPFASDLCGCLTEIGEHTGWIPDAWITGGSAFIQGGCSAAVLFAEAAQKNLPGFDARKALDVLLATMETPSPDPVRHGLFPQWSANGFLPVGVRNCASRTVEYAFHEHCAALLADSAGQPEVAERCRKRAARLWESWSNEHLCFAPRTADGDWDAFNPWRPQRADFWSDPHFYEGTGHDYALTSWHLIPDLVRLHGGPEPFARYLSQCIERCYFWKEINLHIPWLFHYADMPERVAPELHALMDKLVKPGRKGLADNEDMGAWSSWWITAAMGLCPVPGSDRYLLAAPRFERIEINIANCTKPLVLTAAGPLHGVLKSVSLNGQELDRFWVSHTEIGNGAEICFNLQ